MNTVIILFLAFQVLHFICTWKLYVLAGREAWEAAVPFYSAYVLMKIIDRPWWWIVLLYIPVVGNVMALVVWNDTSRAFGYRSFFWGTIVFLSLGLSLGYISYFGSPRYNPDYKRSRTALDQSIIGAIIYAVVAASLLKAFTYEAYTIPTSSMEGSMLVGDFLFVNKMRYGNRLPMTPLAAPLVHDTIPGFGIRSYIPDIQLPYLRLPKMSSVKRNDIVVFNYPVEIEKPIDKKSNYVKRCVAIAGDTLQITRGGLFVNGKPQQWSERDQPQWIYKLYSPTSFYKFVREQGYETQLFNIDQGGGLGVVTTDVYLEPIDGQNNEVMYVFLSDKKLAAILAVYPSVKAEKQLRDPSEYEYDIFPKGAPYNVDNYGPIVIPKAGDIITLDNSTLPMYELLIREYEGNTLETRTEGIYVNGIKTDKYTVRQDYYFMMGDNRHNSLDSRYWGFVPDDHIVGRPALIWMSIKSSDGQSIFKRIRTERLITVPMGEGEARSYLVPVVIAIVVLYGANRLYKKRKKNKKK